jgi:hypothetical protein
MLALLLSNDVDVVCWKSCRCKGRDWLDGGAVEQRRIERLGGAGSTNSRAEINVGLFQLTVTTRKLSTIFASKLEVRAERDS